MLPGHAIVQAVSFWHLGKLHVGFEVDILAVGWVSLSEYFDFSQAVYKQCFILVFIFMAILSDEEAKL
jgi:hypothetical protein